MYYAGIPPNGNQSLNSPGADNPNIYMSAPSPYGPAPTGYPPGHPALAARYAAAPQAYAVVSNGGPTGYTTISPAYASMQYSGMQCIPTSSQAYISAGQYPGIAYQTTLAPRSAPGSPYPAPGQAGGPVMAAYSQMPGGIPVTASRSYTIGTMPAYAQAYQLPAAYHGGAAAYGPPF
ncbi:unnamed protein product [Candidula unifasciata]|uniref:Uncharacterized protein n=1 Tax=Candidula unifasciata TaxID=100452 RepID=A0A8S3ZEE2_9EUPU|nr:unnamed protein product [Candidula unifasciata]